MNPFAKSGECNFCAGNGSYTIKFEKTGDTLQRLCPVCEGEDVNIQDVKSLQEICVLQGVKIATISGKLTATQKALERAKEQRDALGTDVIFFPVGSKSPLKAEVKKWNAELEEILAGRSQEDRDGK